jgi:hypothetical protein
MYKQGQSGNPEGRPRGAKNKTGSDLRLKINEFLSDQFPKIVEDFDKLRPRERVRAYCDLLQYGLPKLQAVSMEGQLGNLTDDQLDEVINQLKQSVNE